MHIKFRIPELVMVICTHFKFVWNSSRSVVFPFSIIIRQNTRTSTLVLVVKFILNAGRFFVLLLDRNRSNYLNWYFITLFTVRGTKPTDGRRRPSSCRMFYFYPGMSKGPSFKLASRDSCSLGWDLTLYFRFPTTGIHSSFLTSGRHSQWSFDVQRNWIRFIRDGRTGVGVPMQSYSLYRARWLPPKQLVLSKCVDLRL